MRFSRWLWFVISCFKLLKVPLNIKCDSSLFLNLERNCFKFSEMDIHWTHYVTSCRTIMIYLRKHLACDLWQVIWKELDSMLKTFIVSKKYWCIVSFFVFLGISIEESLVKWMYYTFISLTYCYSNM